MSPERLLQDALWFHIVSSCNPSLGFPYDHMIVLTHWDIHHGARAFVSHSIKQYNQNDVLPHVAFHSFWNKSDKTKVEKAVIGGLVVLDCGCSYRRCDSPQLSDMAGSYWIKYLSGHMRDER